MEQIHRQARTVTDALSAGDFRRIKRREDGLVAQFFSLWGAIGKITLNEII